LLDIRVNVDTRATRGTFNLVCAYGSSLLTRHVDSSLVRDGGMRYRRRCYYVANN